MSESLDSEVLIIREPYDRIFRWLLLISTAINLVLVLGWIIAEFLGSSLSSLQLTAAAIAMCGYTSVIIAYGSRRAYLEFRVSDKRLTVWVWPFRLTSILVTQILSSEAVEIDPKRDYGGWGLKGTRQDKLVGGRGTAGLRISYTHKSGQKCKLTILTDRAEEAIERIDCERTRRDSSSR